MLREAIKRLINGGLAISGHCIRDVRSVPSFARLASHLDRASLTPATVFDIGVAEGTPWLYARWPDARYILIDPTPQALPHMQRWARKLNADVLSIALGDTTQECTVIVRPEIGGSSLFQDVEDVDVLTREPAVMRRFDDVAGQFVRPALAKIDAQGAELLILRGMGARLADIDCLIIETSLIGSLRGGPEFAEVVAFMQASGFVLFDVIDMIRRPLDMALACVDAVFVPAGSPLRSDRRWGG